MKSSIVLFLFELNIVLIMCISNYVKKCISQMKNLNLLICNLFTSKLYYQ